MNSINPYIGFAGQCREAMSFYQNCLGGELQMQAMSEAPAVMNCAPGSEQDVMHAMLTKNNVVVVMGSDMQGPDGYVRGNNVALNVDCTSEEELKEYFSKFSDGGNVIMAPERTFWNATFCCLKDKFGIGWQFNYTHPSAN